MNTSRPRRLSDYPLWRLIVMLDDAERLVGPDSDSARAIAAAIQQKLRDSKELESPGGTAQCR